MKDFFQSTKFKILAAVFVVLCAFMLRATMSGGLTPLTSQLLSVVTTPLQSAASGISESVGGLYRHLFQAGEIEEENAQLEEKVRTLTQQVADLERYRRENEQLREYLEIKEEHSDFSFASASVIGGTPPSGSTPLPSMPAVRRALRSSTRSSHRMAWWDW